MTDSGSYPVQMPSENKKQKVYRITLMFLGMLGVCFWLDTLCQAGQGAYAVTLKKTDQQAVEIKTETKGQQAAESETGKTESEKSIAATVLDPALSTTRVSLESATPSESTPAVPENDTSLLSSIFQILFLLGDFGCSVGYEYWQAPMPTQFDYQGIKIWEGRPQAKLFSMTLAMNIILWERLELEPTLGYSFGTFQREGEIATGFAREHMTIQSARYGAGIIYTFSSPFFLESGVWGTYTTTTLDIETNFPNFEYTGFLLDKALATEVTLGTGVNSPATWIIRMRAGVQGYYQFADFGNSQGIRGYILFLLPTSQFHSIELQPPVSEF